MQKIRSDLTESNVSMYIVYPWTLQFHSTSFFRFWVSCVTERLPSPMIECDIMIPERAQYRVGVCRHANNIPNRTHPIYFISFVWCSIHSRFLSLSLSLCFLSFPLNLLISLCKPVLLSLNMCNVYIANHFRNDSFVWAHHHAIDISIGLRICCRFSTPVSRLSNHFALLSLSLCFSTPCAIHRQFAYPLSVRVILSGIQTNICLHIPTLMVVYSRAIQQNCCNVVSISRMSMCSTASHWHSLSNVQKLLYHRHPTFPSIYNIILYTDWSSVGYALFVPESFYTGST